MVAATPTPAHPDFVPRGSRGGTHTRGRRPADVVALIASGAELLEYVRYSSYGVATSYPKGDYDLDGDVDSSDTTALGNFIAGAGGWNLDFNRDGNTDGDDVTDHTTSRTGYTGGMGGRGVLSRSALRNRLGYAGYQFDDTMSAYHVRHRVYFPEIGRWSRRDPAGYVGSTSLSAGGTLSVVQRHAASQHLAVWLTAGGSLDMRWRRDSSEDYCMRHTYTYNQCLACCNVRHEAPGNVECRTACETLRHISTPDENPKCKDVCARGPQLGRNGCADGELTACVCDYPERLLPSPPGAPGRPIGDVPSEWRKQLLSCVARQEACIRGMFNCDGSGTLVPGEVPSIWTKPGIDAQKFKGDCLCQAASCVQSIDCGGDAGCEAFMTVEELRLKALARQLGALCK